MPTLLGEIEDGAATLEDTRGSDDLVVAEVAAHELVEETGERPVDDGAALADDIAVVHVGGADDGVIGQAGGHLVLLGESNTLGRYAESTSNADGEAISGDHVAEEERPGPPRRKALIDRVDERARRDRVVRAASLVVDRGGAEDRRGLREIEAEPAAHVQPDHLVEGLPQIARGAEERQRWPGAPGLQGLRREVHA